MSDSGYEEEESYSENINDGELNLEDSPSASTTASPVMVQPTASAVRRSSRPRPETDLVNPNPNKKRMGRPFKGHVSQRSGWEDKVCARRAIFRAFKRFYTQINFS